MKKVAILFGNDDYMQYKLKNAANDAAAISRKLTELGFDCRCFVNINRRIIEEQIFSFKSELGNADVGLFFFAGHGVQCDGENYLTALDTSFVDESSCKFTSTPLNYIIDTFEKSKVNTKIIILDACRDNPFTSHWRSSVNSGLAPVYAPKGTIIAYATSPGQRASDGIGEHGIYTSALLMHIGTKRLTIEDMFKRVRNTVSSQTQNKQITWEHTSLMGTFCFNSGYDDGKFSTSYSKTALADSEYTFEEDNNVQKIVKDLKSYNWYTQNPAINRILKLNFYAIEIDELFVLGRNIYQTACGNSGSGIGWIENIESNLNVIPENAAFHILNGILFEIYFDSYGNLRDRLKALYYENPVRLCQKEKYNSSGSFIRSYLEQYPQRIIYLPGSTEVMCVDAVINFDQTVKQYYLDGIFFEGLSCMCEEDGEELYKYEYSYSLNELNPLQITSIIEKMIVVPKNKLKISFSINLKADDKILCPFEFVLARFII